ncbi:MAG TPA: type II secretion system F family protein [Geminicoccus sp.]|jgi:tight adherence protein C|uniref:type II secretion system F family protein n=1 Tax=Geminicoccus sp. TaxID=2024832 RepID=UPI002E366369|nr:type II secretion system F family protein [Geminicoccus sp.]HEX2526648.1 type II secretion system F family protein [Geminicoccus sp.]
MVTPTVIAAVAAGLAALSLSVVVAILLAHVAEEGDLIRRIRVVMHPSDVQTSAGTSLALSAASMFARLGEAARGTALISAQDLAQLERAIGAAGFDARRAASAFIGMKIVVMLGLPVLGYLLGAVMTETWLMHGLLVAPTLFLGVFGPNWVLRFLRGPYLRTLRKGLPDALDLMVVCGEAGLGLESAVNRVAREMERSSPAVAREFTILSQELRMLPDRREALMRMGERTNLEGYRRLGSTLAQALHYGTPLTQALRVLAAEMRQERMVAMEEKAARLPALLVMPLILFIMPSLFIVLIGPSILQLMNNL